MLPSGSAWNLSGKSTLIPGIGGEYERQYGHKWTEEKTGSETGTSNPEAWGVSEAEELPDGAAGL